MSKEALRKAIGGLGFEDSIPCMMRDMTLDVKYIRLLEFEKAEQDLKKAKTLIKRLRVENKALKLEKVDAKNKLQNRIKTLGKVHHFGFRLAARTLGLSLGNINNESE